MNIKKAGKLVKEKVIKQQTDIIYPQPNKSTYFGMQRSLFPTHGSKVEENGAFL